MKKSCSLAAVALAALVCLSSIAAFAQSLNIERGRAKDILNVVSHDIQKNYYDPAMKGLDWKSLTQQAATRIDNAKNAGEMYTAIFWLANNLQDSHTIFIPPSRQNRPIFGFKAKPYGDAIMVYDITKGGAAEAAGLQLGDRINTVNTLAAMREDFSLMMLLFRALRPVAVLNLEVERGREHKTIRVEAKIRQNPHELDLTKMDTVYQLIREEESEEENFRYKLFDDGVGYLSVPDFVGWEADYVAMAKKIDRAKAEIIDLRGNHGGATRNLAQFAGTFEQQPTEMAEMVGAKLHEKLEVKPQRPNLSGPMFILLDSESASAAEAFARHFQLEKHAVIIGDRSAGKLTVARIFPEHTGADSAVFFAVEVTVARFVFPGGEEVEKKGVTPDVFCLPTADDLRQKNDPCYARAYELAKQSLAHATTASVRTK